MALKPTYETQDEIPEAARELYEEKDGKFALALEGVVPAADVIAEKRKTDEFRENNRKLNSRVESMEEKLSALKPFEDLDPDDIKSKLKAYDELKGKGVTKGDDIDARLEEFREKIRAEEVNPLREEFQKLSKREKEAEEKLRRKNLETDFTKAALKVGVNEKALGDVLRRAFSDSKTDEENRLVFTDSSGKTRYSEDSGEPMGVVDYFRALQEEAPYFFSPNKGGGAGGSKGGGTGKFQKLIDGNDPIEMGKHIEGLKNGTVGIR